MDQKKFENIDLNGIHQVLNEISSLLQPGIAVLVQGEMGSGKTTFIQELLKNLGISNPEGSPTYAIIQSYSSKKFGTIYHIDPYRIQSKSEAYELGLDELFEENALFLVEWPEIISTFLPERFIKLEIETNSPNCRNFILSYDN